MDDLNNRPDLTEEDKYWIRTGKASVELFGMLRDELLGWLIVDSVNGAQANEITACELIEVYKKSHNSPLWQKLWRHHIF